MLDYLAKIAHFILFRFRELVDSLPQAVKENRYCVNRLERLEAMSSYIYHFTDAMSKAMLLEVLGTLHTWELTAPDVEPAIRVSHGSATRKKYRVQSPIQYSAISSVYKYEC